MQTTNSQNPLQQECLKNLQKILDLAMHTAEAASTEGNHKVVLQAVREVTRIITLMTKLSQNTDQQVKPKSRSASAQAQIPALAPRNSKAGAPASAEEMQLIQRLVEITCAAASPGFWTQVRARGPGCRPVRGWLFPGHWLRQDAAGTIFSGYKVGFPLGL